MIDQTEELEIPLELRRRRHKRYGQAGSVTLRRVVTGPNLYGDLFDLSLGGCLIWLEVPVRFQNSDVIQVKLEAGNLLIRAMGAVRYTSEAGRIVGLEFQGLRTEETVALQEYISDLEAAALLETSLACY